MHMKKRTIEYQEEPGDEGWRFNPAKQALGETAQRRLGIPAPNPAGTQYEHKESKGRVVVKAMRGGKRPGAGRKPSGHVRLNLLVPTETRKQLEKLAHRDQVTLSEAFRRTLATH
jgi:hypothetical protein